MKDIVMVIENYRGQEVNSLLTFDDFIEKHVVPYVDSYREAAEMTAALFRVQRDRTEGFQDWYHAANESFYARLCGSRQELDDFLSGMFNDDREFRFDEQGSSKACLEALQVHGMTGDGRHTEGQHHPEETYPVEEKLFDIEIREILSRVENIRADTLGDAIDKAMEMYERSEVVLNADDYQGVDYIPVNKKER